MCVCACVLACLLPLLLLLLLLLLVFLLFLLLLACGCMSRTIRRGHKYKSFQVEYKYRTTVSSWNLY